jgi:chromosome segregation ATPase
MSASKACLLASVMLAVALTPTGARAAEKKADPNKEQIRRLLLSQRKLEQEKVILAQEKDAVAAELGEVKKKVEGEARRVATLRKELDTQRTEKEAVAGKLAETEAALQKLLEQQRATEAERKRLDALAAQQKQSIAGCEAKNEKLHQHGVELLERYQQKGCFDAALQADPFTGLKRVEIENFVEDNREKLDEQKLGR